MVQSDKTILEWVNKNEPVAEGYSGSVPEMVIPLSLREVFLNFFANDAPYSFD